MPKIKAVGLQRRTIGIMNDFFYDIDMLNDKNLSSYQMNLPIRVKKFFDDMNKLGEQEFAEFLKKHQFENRDPAQHQKYTDALYCLVALIVNEYAESDLLRYFIPKKYSIEAKPILESNTSRFVYWMKFLSYWLGSKLFDRQKFKMYGAENESLGSAIKAIKQDLSESNYFDLLQKDSFKENLETVVGKFVENRNKANVEPAENDTSSNGDVPAQIGDSNESFREGGFKFGSSVSTPELTTKSTPPSPPPPPPAPTGTVNPVSASPGPSASLVKSTKSPVRKAVSNNDSDTLFADIRNGVKLKSVKEREKLPNMHNVKSNDPYEALKGVLAKRRNDIQDDPGETHDEGKDEDWLDGTTEQPIAIQSKVQHQAPNSYGRFFSNLPASGSKTGKEMQRVNENSCTL